MRRRTDLQQQPTSQSDRLTDCQDGSADRSTDKDGQTTEKTDGQTRCADGNTDGCTDGQTRANQLGSVGSSRCRHGAPSEAISMDQPGKASNFCRSDSATVFARSPSPSPPSPWSWVPTCQISSYFIILLLVIVYCLLFTIHYRHPLTPPALCRYARTP